jgi:surface antigen
LRRLLIALGGWGLIILSCYPAIARTSHDAHGGNCVAYAREVTGVHLDGNAAAWWPHAAGRYDRGHRPEVGAILVFKPYAGMHVGHVAVVSRVVDAREILVDQANWVRGRVTKAISVVDASPLNDWTSVKVQYQGTHGRENPTYGFIYSHESPAELGQAVADEAPDRRHAEHAAARAEHHKDAGEQETAEKPDAPRHIAERAKPHKHGDDTQIASTGDPSPPHVAEHVAPHRDRLAREEANAYAALAAHQLAAAEPAHHKHHKAEDARLAYVY